MRPHRASGLIVGGLLVAALGLAGCSSSVKGSASGEETDSTTTSAASSSTTKPAGPAKCVASQLAGSLTEGDAAAGQRYATLAVKNSSATACTLSGYAGLGLYFMSGTPLPTDAQRVLQPGPALVSLAPGESAKTNLHWTVVPTGNEPANPCQPPPEQLRIIPPDDTKQVSIAWTFGSVCNKGRLDESAFYK